MLKIRLQGTTNDIKWFQKILQRDKRINVLEMSKSTQIKEQKNIFVCMQKLIRLSGRNSKRRRKLCVE